MRRDPAETAEAREWRRLVLIGVPLRSAGADPGWPVDPHHIIKAQQLRRHAADAGIEESVLVYDPRVGMPVTRARHERHHSRFEPILRSDLPAAVFEFAAEHDLMWMLDRDYPA